MLATIMCNSSPLSVLEVIRAFHAHDRNQVHLVITPYCKFSSGCIILVMLVPTCYFCLFVFNHYVSFLWKCLYSSPIFFEVQKVKLCTIL